MNLRGWRERVQTLKRDAYALYLAVRDPRVPWYAKALAAVIVGYVFSPIDLIPDFIPVLGYLDELVLVPLGIMAVKAMIPENVLAECRDRASNLAGEPYSRIAAVIIVALWLAIAAAAAIWLYRRFGTSG